MVHISQFYPCSEVGLAGELYYICELGKYSKMNYNTPVSLDGVLLKKVLRKSPMWEHFRLAVDEGWLVGVNGMDSSFAVSTSYPLNVESRLCRNYFICTEEVPYDSEDRRLREVDADYDMRQPVKLQVSFEKMIDAYWLWSMGGENNSKFLVNNNALNHNRSDQTWLSVIAMVAVRRLFEGTPNRLLIDLNSQALLNELSISYVMILSEDTLALRGWCDFHFDDVTVSENRRLQLGYISWYVKGRDKGLCDRWYNGDEKYKYATTKLGIMVGDLVLYYKREKAQKGNLVKSISSFHLAKVLKFTNKRLSLEVINTTKPYYQGKADFEDHTTAVKQMYAYNPPYEKMVTSVENLNLIDVGVEYLLFTEGCFIVPLDSSDDLRVTTVTDGERVDKLYLRQNDYIYWILKDYDYDFNEERFLARFFPNTEPAYTRYMRGESLEDEYYCMED